jgi:hypothetical protein
VVLNAILIGVCGQGAGFYLIDGITNLAFLWKAVFSVRWPRPGNHLGLAVILVPIVGAVIVGLMARFGSKAIGGHGIPEAMEKIILDESRIPPAITFLKPLSAAISIGTGGPFGAEGADHCGRVARFGSLTGAMDAYFARRAEDRAGGRGLCGYGGDSLAVRWQRWLLALETIVIRILAAFGDPGGGWLV